MQMNIKRPTGLLKQSVIIMDVMSGEDKMFYLSRMWDLYFKIYHKKSSYKKKSKYTLMRKRKAYELCTNLVKIFGH